MGFFLHPKQILKPQAYGGYALTAVAIGQMGQQLLRQRSPADP
jgi:hypothetical protein